MVALVSYGLLTTYTYIQPYPKRVESGELGVMVSIAKDHSTEKHK